MSDNKKALKLSSGLVDLWGFEPQLTEPKSAVLPLHHRSVPIKKNFPTVVLERYGVFCNPTVFVLRVQR